MIQEHAKAKINLTLEILGKRADGYHELQSLVVFADIADRLNYTPSMPYGILADGPFAMDIVGDNLIHQATLALQNLFVDFKPGQFYLEKVLPISSGMGGGSADAAAAVRCLLKDLLPRGPNQTQLNTLLRSLGADVPVCFEQHAAFMKGIGEQLHLVSDMPRINCVLVNPQVHVSTAQIFKTLNALSLPENWENTKTIPKTFLNYHQVIAYLKDHKNDLQLPAIAYAPVIAEVLGVLEHLKGCDIVRMSGSGATCFALFQNFNDASAAYDKIRFEYPEWWCVQTIVG